MMPHTPHRPLDCTHERGVGTTLCLHCRREARIAAREKRKRLMLRGSAAAIVIATGLAATALGATAIRGRKAVRPDSTARVSVAARVGPVVAAPIDSTPAAPVTAVVSKPAENPVPPVAPMTPTIALGSSPLA